MNSLHVSRFKEDGAAMNLSVLNSLVSAVKQFFINIFFSPPKVSKQIKYCLFQQNSNFQTNIIEKKIQTKAKIFLVILNDKSCKNS